MKPHKDLPSGSQPWAQEVDALLAEVKVLREVVKRLAGNAGIDYSTPQRGLNAGNTPSIKSPVGQKLSSLADVATYNVADGQVLSWSQAGQKWLPVTPLSGGAIDIPMKYTSGYPMIGYGQLDEATSTWAYTGTNTNGDLEQWATNTMYLASGNWADGPVALITLSNDGFGRPQVELYCEDYGDNTFSSLEVYSYGIRVSSPLFKPPTTSTANRPTPSGLGVTGDPGCQSYDYDLNIPIWWNGTQWTNALNTAV